MAFQRNKERRARLAELHAQGLNDQQIADDMGIHRTSVHEMRTAMGLPRQSKAVLDQTRWERAADVDRFLAACAKAGVVIPRPKNTTNTVRAA